MGEPAPRLNPVPSQGGGGDLPPAGGGKGQNPPAVLSREEMAALLRAASWDRNPFAVRDRAMIAWTYWTAARVSEVVGMTWRDMDRGRGRIVFYRPKRRDWHPVPVPPQGWADLDRWLVHSGLAVSREGLLFPLSTSQARRRIQLVGGWAGLPPAKCLPHALRHTRLTRLLESGAPLHAVQLIAGHKRPETTAGYLHVAQGWLDDMAALGGI